MTATEDRLRFALRAAADQSSPLLTFARIASGVRRRRRRQTVGLITATALVVAGVATALTEADFGSASNLQTVITTPSPAPTTAADARAFAVAAPDLRPNFPGHGPVALANCTPKAITASIATAATQEGVDGRLLLTGQGCAPRVDAASLRIAYADGGAPPITVAPANATNRAATNPFIQPYLNKVQIGFAWTGSFCSRKALVVLVGKGAAELRVPLKSVTPPCKTGDSGLLSLGIVGSQFNPVVPAPASWLALRSELTITAAAPNEIAYTVRLSNTSKKEINLADPCPAYNESYIYFAYGTSPNDRAVTDGPGGDLCDQALSVPAHDSITLNFSQHIATPAFAGTQMTISWAIAGVATATGHRKVS